ncbi:ATP-NAD kinase [Haloarcula taiwanensis]|uniref:ATP-NAD kinase n=1 Tax=Haloarcula taiwanensis TaxID=1932004 RepID=A0A2H4ZXL5_9EURY|nr:MULTISPECIES: NAD(+)/NADH kinase [Haloarcula]AUG47229.1 ATP-NAD kinase [Haloarcula taiwanensis]RLM33474.1 ATP-NAD kinase [Haloarcula sp. Atlit-120R]RLM42124.1 ATP-NAD kinase [Haloarcula sp. Atlit-47R]RLM95489.1 ATP-NAD kinase [Haloarcula sp. Atlit-7R]
MGTPIGVVGDNALADVLRDAGMAVERGRDGAVPKTNRVVAVGEDAVAAVARAVGDPLVLPVAAGRGVRSVPRDDAVAAVSGLAEARVERHPVLRVTMPDGTVEQAFWDVTLVTADAARISEFTVTSTADRIGQFRADGVVIATAAGSPGYAHRVGGPILAPSEQAVVAPIAPFATDPDHWVLPADGLNALVERDEATVKLLVDDHISRPVSYQERITISLGSPVRTAVVDESRSRFE